MWGLLFALVSLLLYLKFEASGRRGWYVLSVAAFVAALLGKTSVVMLPFLLLFYQWGKTGNLRKKDFARTAPFFLTSLVLGLVTVWFQFRPMVSEKPPIGNYLERLAGAGYVVWFYIAKALCPTHLSLIYAQWDYARLQLWPTAALIALLAVLWRFRRGNSSVQACWIALVVYVAILLPVLGFVPMSFMRFAMVADHFQYPALPALTALAGALAAGTIEFFRSRPSRSAIDLGRPVVAAGCCLLLVLLAGLTAQQCKTFKDAETLWNDTLAKVPNCWLACYNMGNALVARGQTDEAIALYRKTLALKPDHVESHNNLGIILERRGSHADFQEAIDHYRKSLEIRPNQVEAHFDLGNAMDRRGENDEAIFHFQKTIEINPGHVLAHNNLGLVFARCGRIDEAIVEFKKALEIEPDYARAHYQFGLALAGRNQVDEAREHFKRGLDSALAGNDKVLAAAIQADIAKLSKK